MNELQPLGMIAVDTVVQETKTLLGRVQQDLTFVMKNLYFLRENDSWKVTGADSWGHFLEGELGISQSFGSKLANTYEHYVINGGVTLDSLAGIDYEKLYAARKLSGTTHEQLAKAKTLSRAELRQERQDDEPHAFEPVTYCKVCGGSEQNHARD